MKPPKAGPGRPKAREGKVSVWPDGRRYQKTSAGWVSLDDGKPLSKKGAVKGSLITPKKEKTKKVTRHKRRRFLG